MVSWAWESTKPAHTETHFLQQGPTKSNKATPFNSVTPYEIMVHSSDQRDQLWASSSIALYLILKGRVSHWTWIVEILLDCLADKFAKHTYLSFSMLDFRRHHDAPILCGFWESEFNTLFTDASFQSWISPLIIYFFRKNCTYNDSFSVNISHWVHRGTIYKHFCKSKKMQRHNNHKNECLSLIKNTQCI